MVKACIVYFSQTGNTENVAFTIMGRLTSAGINTICLPLSDVVDFPEAFEGIDILGIGFPTFFGYPPPMVMDLIDDLKDIKGESTFVFTTYGGTTAGDSLYDAACALRRKGFGILGGLKLEGADSYPQSLSIKKNAGRPNFEDLAIAEEFTDKILDAFNSGRSIDPEKLASSTKYFEDRREADRKSTVAEMRKHVEGKIKFNPELCLFCESCKKSCPTKSITTGDKFPEFSWRCIGGMRCYQCVRVCPGKALSVDYPGPIEEYKKFMEIAADSEEEKRRVYVVA
ncbi:4Fe-4S ferredoxin [Methanocella sp. CWC-04]|uniref:4Fe-4S ferredoxin n=1 Tax=Methanooceanicella nereidis TaxID=2052831 RepID=A0AAP2RC37_9EURY|nr:EFR1 family ferrodoxin [Methanocella sp. CWC-04]MCD1294623.1 4Fe-4S ferredoxin [Methanocella sp. CWC-04]